MIKRILIVGLGSIGKRHLALCRKLLPDADIRVLSHRPLDLIPEYATGCFSTLAEAIKFSPQIAVIANPSTVHVSIARPLAEIGTHLLIEKPLAAAIEGVEELLTICHEKNTTLLIDYNLRFLLSLQKFHQLLNENIIGQVLSVRCEVGQYLPSWRPNTDYRQGVSARQELGGGVLLELSHELDYLRWIFGEIDWVKATLIKQSSLEIDVEDTAHLTLGFFASENQPPLIAQVNMDFIRHDATRLCTAIGVNGSLRWNGFTGVVDQFEGGGENWREIFCYQHHREESYLAVWQHFLNCVGGLETPLITGADGLAVLRIIQAARLAAEIDSQVQINSMKTKLKSRL